MKKIIVSGACGRMGSEVVKTVFDKEDTIMVGAYDKNNSGKDIHKLLNVDGPEVIISSDLNKIIENTNPDIIIDFTSPDAVMDNIKLGLDYEIDMIVGTTGITDIELKKIKAELNNKNMKILIAPNFAIGAVLMMKFSEMAAKYMDDVEIIELHHNKKIDAPSGTSLKTAELIKKELKDDSVEEIEKIKGVRGGISKNIHIHSVRLPGLVAHQEIIFGAKGQTLTIRHDSYDRSSFMPGIEMAIDNLNRLDGLTYGLENLFN